jgi:hypothetical protein
VQIIFADRGHYDFASVHSNSHLQWRLACPSQIIAIPAHLLLHAQRRIECTLGMIFVRKRRTEQRKDTIA